MTPAEYRTALATLGLSQLAAGRWLGVSKKTAQNYATLGPSPCAAKAIRMAVGLAQVERWDACREGDLWADNINGDLVKYSDLSAIVGLPVK